MGVLWPSDVEADHLGQLPENLAALDVRFDRRGLIPFLAGAKVLRACRAPTLAPRFLLHVILL